MINSNESKLRALYESLQGINENTSKTTPAQKGSEDGKPSTKKSGFTYQDEDGNLYHSDVEIASYIDPKTGKEAKVFSYGKGAGLGAKTKKPLAVVSGMRNESARLRRNHRGSSLTESSIKNLGDTFYSLGSTTFNKVKSYAEKNGLKSFRAYGDKDDDSTSFSNDEMDIQPYKQLLISASEHIAEAANDEGLMDEYKKALNSNEPVEAVKGFFNDNSEKLGAEAGKDDLPEIHELSGHKPDEWFVMFYDASKGQRDADKVSEGINSQNESARLRRLMRENRRLRRVLRGKSLNEASELNNSLISH